MPEEVLSSPKTVILVMKKETMLLSLSLTSCSKASLYFYTLWFLLLFLPPSLGD